MKAQSNVNEKAFSRLENSILHVKNRKIKEKLNVFR